MDWLWDPPTLILQDDSTAVKVHPPYSDRALVTYPMGSRYWKTFVHCGPPADLPSISPERQIRFI